MKPSRGIRNSLHATQSFMQNSIDGVDRSPLLAHTRSILNNDNSLVQIGANDVYSMQNPMSPNKSTIVTAPRYF